MIRINLIQKKQASYVDSAEGSKLGGLGGLADLRLSALKNLTSVDSEKVKALAISVGIPIILSIAANFAYDTYVGNKRDQMSAELDGLSKEKDNINKELQKIKGFETVKVELERNELVLRAKIDTIEKLIRGRDVTVKSLVSLAQAMPRDIWLTDIKATENSFEFQGGTVDLGLVNQFMTKLGGSIYFKDVTLKTMASDSTGNQAKFDLTARRE